MSFGSECPRHPVQSSDLPQLRIQMIPAKVVQMRPNMFYLCLLFLKRGALRLGGCHVLICAHAQVESRLLLMQSDLPRGDYLLTISQPRCTNLF
eukprot:3713967-Amphidinium_carterae.1